MNLLLAEALLKRIDDFRFSKRIETRAEAIRMLIENGLKTKAT